MSWFRLCDADPLVTTLHEVFGANIVRVPEERVQPLCVVATRDGRAAFRGDLAPLLQPGDLPLGIGPEDIMISQMANVSGKKTRVIDIDLGLNILEGFLSGLGIPAAGVKAAFQGATRVSFSFNNVQRHYIDTNALGRALSGKHVDTRQPSAAIFFSAKPYAFLVIDSTIRSSDFTISVEEARTTDFKVKIPEVQQLLASINAGVTVHSATGRDLAFQGRKHLTFAFTCVRFWPRPDGRVAHVEPNFEKVILSERADEQTDGPHRIQYSPDRVVLHQEAGLIGWEEVEV